MPALDHHDIDAIEGELTELLSAGHYTYVRLSIRGHDAWVVVLGEPALEVGTRARFTIYGSRSNFHSARLGRDFSLLHFGHPVRS